MPSALFLLVPDNGKPRALELKTNKGGFPDKENSPNWQALPLEIRNAPYSLYSARSVLHHLTMLEPETVRRAFSF